MAEPGTVRYKHVMLWPRIWSTFLAGTKRRVHGVHSNCSNHYFALDCICLSTGFTLIGTLQRKSWVVQYSEVAEIWPCFEMFHKGKIIWSGGGPKDKYLKTTGKAISYEMQYACIDIYINDIYIAWAYAICTPMRLAWTTKLRSTL